MHPTFQKSNTDLAKTSAPVSFYSFKILKYYNHKIIKYYSHKKLKYHNYKILKYSTQKQFYKQLYLQFIINTKHITGKNIYYSIICNISLKNILTQNCINYKTAVSLINNLKYLLAKVQFEDFSNTTCTAVRGLCFSSLIITLIIGGCKVFTGETIFQ